MVDPIPADAFYDLTEVTEVTVAPDGDRVAFVAEEFDATEDERRRSVFVVPADGSREPHRLSRASDARSPRWSPDGSKLGVLAAREEDLARKVDGDRDGSDDRDNGDDGDVGDGGVGDDGDGDDRDDADGDDRDDADDANESDDADDEPKPQLWVYDLELGGDARQVTDRAEGVSGFDWSPDGERVVVAARDPTDEEGENLQQRRDGGPIETERLQHKFDGTGWLDEVTSYLFVVGLDGETTRLDDAHDNAATVGGWPDPAWGPNGRIAFVSNRTDRPDDNNVDDVYTIAPDGTDLRKLTDGDLRASRLTWSPDGERLAFAVRDPDNWYVPEEVYVARDEPGTHGSVSGDLDRTVGRGGRPRWLDDDALVALIGDEGRSRICQLHAGNESSPERVFERQGEYETLGNLDVGGDTVAFVTSRPAEGADVYAMAADDLDAGEDDPDPRIRLTALNDDLVEAHPMPGCRRVSFESDDGTEVEAIVLYPEDFDPGDPDPRPLLLTIHGGPMSYDEPAFRFQDAFFASRGYVICKVNYRGSTSYGREFCEVLRGAWGTVDVEDLQAGVDELIERGWADPDRLFPTGFSQGGVNTAYLVTRDDRWAAAAAEHGVYDLRSDFGTADAQNWYEADYGLPWENLETYDAHSSITDVGNVETPLLVTAGEEDWRCPPSQSEQLYVSVRKQGVPAKFVLYQDEHHNVGDPDRAIHRLEELAGWFERFDPARDVASEDG